MKLADGFRSLFSIASLLGEIKKIQSPASPAELVNISMECPAIRSQQIGSEFLELAKLVKEQQCKYLLEIGTYRGGTLFVFSQLSAADATIISVDFHFTLLGKVFFVCLKPLFRRFIRSGQSLFLLRKDSHRPDTLASIQDILQQNKLDFLFIDGDHTYDGVREDFRMYAPLVRSGGLIAFHDIARSGGAEEVDKLWSEIKRSYVHKEFIHQTGSGAMGIGVLWI